VNLPLTIDGRAIAARPGQTLFEAATEHGIVIPTLCHHPDLTPVGSCRLCVVEVEGAHAPVTACTHPAAPGLVVRTETPGLRAIRRGVLELLLASYHDAGYRAEGSEPTEFERWLTRYEVARPDPQPPRHRVDSDPNPVVWVDFNKCIVCTRCVRACEEIQGCFVWGVAGRGDDARIVAGNDETMLEARCESCGACAAYCPTGALDDRGAIGLARPERKVTTTCPYCGVGCRFDLNVQDGKISRVTSNPAAAPVNGMSLCVKGRYGHAFVHHPDRLVGPRVRRYLLEPDRATRRPGDRGPWVDVSWDVALDLVAERLAAIRAESGPDAIGVLASAKCTNEENYLAQKLARQVIGTHNVDHCARLCHASTVAGLTMALGSGAMSNTMRDIAEHARALFVIGSNPTEQHPVFGIQLRQAVLRRGTKLIVADPRSIDLVELATLHLRHAPGTDVALLNGLMHVIVERGAYDRSFVEARCEGFDELRETLERYPPERVARITGVPVADIVRAAEILWAARPAAVIFAMGITQHTTGVLNVLALANLQMLLGNLGVPGGGLNPLRGQNNVQGACDMGALPDVFPGYHPVRAPEARRRFADAWRLDDGLDPFGPEPGRTVTELVGRARTGAIRALFVLGENPAVTDPDVHHARACLDACELLIVQEIFPSDTAAFADIVLPGASFAEKDGTFTNTERRVQLVARAVPPPGDARPDWEVLADLARRTLAATGRAPRGPHAGWSYASPAAILDEIAALTPIYAGVSQARLMRGESLHWPVPDRAHPGTPILHAGAFPRGRGKLHAVDHLPPAERPDAAYPLLLTTGRVLYHWHASEMTRRVPDLLELYPEGLIEIAVHDADRLGIADGDRVRVVSRRGEATGRAVVCDRVATGLIFATFHFPGEQNANNLTIAALDPIAKIPEYKVCAVRLERL
jgi:formate dehydrogenase alpha subunit